MDIKWLKARFKGRLLSKLLIYSVLYGLFSINYIDLVVPGSSVPGYHLWLVIAYFVPFIPLLLIFDLEDWELVGSLGLTCSLMNDVFYYPIGILLFQKSVDLSEWYMFQLGFRGLASRWSFNVGAFRVPVTSLLMGMTIYLRIAVVVGLVYRWSHRKARSFQDLVQETFGSVLKRFFGEEPANIILRYVKKRASSKGEKEGVKGFFDGLREFLGLSASVIVENQVFKKVYSKLERLLGRD